MPLTRRELIVGLGAGASGIVIGDLLDGDFDLPYKVGGTYLNAIKSGLEPGESVPDHYIGMTPLPDDYQSYIDPSIDATFDEINEFEYKRDLTWTEPEEYLEKEVGDCEEYALTAASILEGRGEEAKVVLGAIDGIGHMLAEDRSGDLYSVGYQGPQEEIAGWEPMIEFSVREEMQHYTHETP